MRNVKVQKIDLLKTLKIIAVSHTMIIEKLSNTDLSRLLISITNYLLWPDIGNEFSASFYGQTPHNNYNSPV